jgi:hypothetical protein
MAGLRRTRLLYYATVAIGTLWFVRHQIVATQVVSGYSDFAQSPSSCVFSDCNSSFSRSWYQAGNARNGKESTTNTNTRSGIFTPDSKQHVHHNAAAPLTKCARAQPN